MFQLQIITLHTTPRVKYRSLNVRASLRCATNYFKREMEIRTFLMTLSATISSCTSAVHIGNQIMSDQLPETNVRDFISPCDLFCTRGTLATMSPHSCRQHFPLWERWQVGQYKRESA